MQHNSRSSLHIGTRRFPSFMERRHATESRRAGFETRILSKYTQEKEEGLTYRQLLTYNVDQENIELRNRHLQEDRGMTQATARRLVGGEGGVFKFSQPIF